MLASWLSSSPSSYFKNRKNDGQRESRLNWIKVTQIHSRGVPEQNKTIVAAQKYKSLLNQPEEKLLKAVWYF